jgi:hypothetical protein
MITDSIIQKERRKAYASLWSWLLTIVPAIIGLSIWFSLRSLVVHLLIVTKTSTWSWDAIDVFSFIGFGVIWLASVFFIQHMLYKGAIHGSHWIKLSKLCALMLTLLLLNQLILLALGGTELSMTEVVTYILEALSAVLLFIVAIKYRSRT